MLVINIVPNQNIQSAKLFVSMTIRDLPLLRVRAFAVWVDFPGLPPNRYRSYGPQIAHESVLNFVSGLYPIGVLSVCEQNDTGAFITIRVYVLDTISEIRSPQGLTEDPN